jgi:hypothetical protein
MTIGINGAWDTIREDIKISAEENLGYYKLKQHKQCFEEICSALLDNKKQARAQWLQDLRQINGDNMNNLGHQVIGNFRNQRRKYLKDKSNEL